MKNIVIAAGYATRLGELTKNFPKPLLKIGKNTILGRMLDDIDKIDDIDEHIIITNHKFADIFEKWKTEEGRWKKPITIVKNMKNRVLIQDTDVGKELIRERDELKELVAAYRSGAMKQKRSSRV